MLFNSVEFLFVFLPVALLLFYSPALCRPNPQLRRKLCVLTLGFCSLAFYSWWDATFVPVILASVLFNLALGLTIERGGSFRGLFLLLGVSGNVLALAHYKYLNFLISMANDAFGADLAPVSITLPLGISFFTFTQIAYLVDIYRGVLPNARRLDSTAVVLFFPHLVAGPILYHHEMLAQFQGRRFGLFDRRKFAVGLVIFIIGLGKKLFIADNLAPYANSVFTAVAAGHLPNLGESWRGALAYTLQLYFDFSGYSDMAVGLANMFGLLVPLNFFSPYKATNFIEFWRRWHISLSIFLKNYLYIPLGGNRRGRARKYLNVAAVMVVCGIWHGAGWTFIIWGAFHGICLLANHAWRDHVLSRRKTPISLPGYKLVCGLLTFLLVVVGWVVFRAETMPQALAVLTGMFGLNPKLPHRVAGGGAELWIALGLALAWLAPNTRQIVRDYRVALDVPSAPIPSGWSGRLLWRPTLAAATAVALVFLAALDKIVANGHGPIFLYFQF